MPTSTQLATGLGGAIGGSTAYVAGLVSSRDARKSRWFRPLEWLMRRFGGLIIFVFATIPFLPGDLASIIAGAARYPFRKYLVYNSLGNMIKMTAIAYLGADLITRLENIIT